MFTVTYYKAAVQLLKDFVITDTIQTTSACFNTTTGLAFSAVRAGSRPSRDSVLQIKPPAISKYFQYHEKSLMLSVVECRRKSYPSYSVWFPYA